MANLIDFDEEIWEVEEVMVKEEIDVSIRDCILRIDALEKEASQLKLKETNPFTPGTKQYFSTAVNTMPKLGNPSSELPEGDCTMVLDCTSIQ